MVITADGCKGHTKVNKPTYIELEPTIILSTHLNTELFFKIANALVKHVDRKMSCDLLYIPIITVL